MNPLLKSALFMLVIISSITVARAQGGNFAAVSQSVGKPVYSSAGGSKKPVDVASIMKEGDVVILGKGDRINLIVFSLCREWEITGPTMVTLQSGIRTGQGPVREIGSTPGCRDYTSVEVGSAQRAALTSIKGSLAPRASAGGDTLDSASGTQLMTSMLASLQKGENDKALLMYDEIEKRNPTSPEVVSMGERLGMRQGRPRLFVGQGYGPMEDRARSVALADLSSTILSDVKSEFKQYSAQIGQKDEMEVRELITINSDLPIMGATFTSYDIDGEVLVRASMDIEDARELYSRKLGDINKELLSKMNDYGATTSAVRKLEILQSALALVEGFDRYKSVAVIIGCKHIPAPEVSADEIKNMIRRHETSAGELELAADLLTRGLDAKLVYAYPVVPTGSHEVTQFASVLRDLMTARLNSVESPDKAASVLTGTYEIMDDAIEITYNLIDKEGVVLKSRHARLAPECYAGYDYKPKGMSFDRLLYEGAVVSSDFRVQVATDYGATNLVFKDGEAVELLVKSNRACYFYIVGHVIKETEQYSYLLPLNRASGNRKYLYYIGDDSVNKWVNIARFKVRAPFGIESVQIVASIKDVAESLPYTEFDEKTQLNLISQEPQSGVRKVRALEILDDENDARGTEAVMLFTTIER